MQYSDSLQNLCSCSSLCLSHISKMFCYLYNLYYLPNLPNFLIYPDFYLLFIFVLESSLSLDYSSTRRCHSVSQRSREHKVLEGMFQVAKCTVLSTASSQVITGHLRINEIFFSDSFNRLGHLSLKDLSRLQNIPR